MFLVILYHVFYLWNKKYVFLYMENIHSTFWSIDSTFEENLDNQQLIAPKCWQTPWLRTAKCLQQID